MAESQRTRNWAFIVYPDSEKLLPDWRDILAQMGLECAISPLHDKDVYPKDVFNSKTGELIHKAGDVKKAHYHVVIVFDSVKAKPQVQEICAKIGANEQPERIMNLRGALRYLTHQDCPNKAQYSREDVELIGGMEYDSVVNSAKEEERETTSRIGHIMSVMAERNIWNFSELSDYLISEEPEYFDTYRKNSYFFGQYLKQKIFYTEKA